MNRTMFLMVAAVWLCPVLLSSGCSEEKTTTIERSERIEESQPQMVSPGQERVE